MTTEHTGHRARLLQRFETSGLDSFQDYEVIELLLAYAIPRKDTKPIAKKLIDRYKTLSAILSASPAELSQTEGLGERTAGVFPFVKNLLARSLREKYQHESVIAHRTDVEDYLRFHFGYLRSEYIAALFLDNRNHVIATDIIAEGTVNQCALYPRDIVNRALKNSAAALIIAHNHPGGGLEPSEADWQITERLIAIGKLLDMPLVDHIIISKQTNVSLRALARWPK